MSVLAPTEITTVDIARLHGGNRIRSDRHMDLPIHRKNWLSQRDASPLLHFGVLIGDGLALCVGLTLCWIVSVERLAKV